jgi:hypothetical protein
VRLGQCWRSGPLVFSVEARVAATSMPRFLVSVRRNGWGTAEHGERVLEQR